MSIPARRIPLTMYDVRDAIAMRFGEPRAIVPGPPVPMAIEQISRALDILDDADIEQADLSVLARTLQRGERLCLARLVELKRMERA